MIPIRSVRTAAAVLLAGVVVGLLSGCGGEQRLPPEPRPEVVWPDGEPSGPFEEDPWVRAVRASELELAVAIYTRDFTGGELLSTTSLRVRGSYLMGTESRADSGRPRFPLGPPVMIPIGVEEKPDGKSATVYSCLRLQYATVDDPQDSDLPGAGTWIGHEVTLQDDGTYQVQETWGAAIDFEKFPHARDLIDPREHVSCSVATAPAVVFDPPPDVKLEYTSDDIWLGTEPES